MAVGIRRRGVDLGGPDGVHARRDRLAKSATDVAAWKLKADATLPFTPIVLVTAKAGSSDVVEGLVERI